MKKNGTFDSAAKKEWERVRRELKRGAHKSLKEHNKAKLMVLNTDAGSFLPINGQLINLQQLRRDQYLKQQQQVLL